MAILLLALMGILVPVMVLFTLRETKWAVKGGQATGAFHEAEAGIEKGYRAISTSTGVWYALIEEGTGIPNFLYDHKFDDVNNGYYVVGISSGPGDKQATIIAIAKSYLGEEVRAIKAVYQQNTMGDIAIQAMSGVSVAGGVDVEWGAVVGAGYIDTGDRTYPQFHSAAGLSVDNDPAPENCDQPNCWQWFAFDPDVPADPEINLALYRSSAQVISAACPSGGTPEGSCYYNTPQSWSSYDYTGGGTVFVENNLTVGAPGVNITGNLIVTGNLSTTSGGWGKGSGSMRIPQTAWKQYGNDWAHYRPFDTAEPDTFPGLDSTYLSASNLTYTPSPDGKTAIRGFIYVGGAFSTSGGGGNAYIYGTMFSKGSVSVAANSGVTVYYNKEAANGIHTKRVILSRVSWQDVLRQWPAGL
ncbi:MAG: hypothetical protein HYZ75_07970 [Elusimicrobia bacterium]|nr:hypothetical protein [Elusimicrobiota bacterium]